VFDAITLLDAKQDPVEQLSSEDASPHRRSVAIGVVAPLYLDCAPRAILLG